MSVNGAVATFVLIAPDVVEQVATAEAAARMAGQQQQQVVLLHR